MGASGRRRAPTRLWDSRRAALLVIAAVLILAPLAGTVHGEPGTAMVSYGGMDYEVAYDAVGVSVDTASVDETFASLNLGVQVGGPGSGTLEVVLERALIDARDGDGSADVEFIVIYDGGEEATVEEIETTDASRTIRFSLPAGSDEVDILGTFVGGGGEGQAPADDPPADDPPADDPPADDPPAGETSSAVAGMQGQDPPEPFVEPGADPVEDYVKRYATEPAYAAWFDENFAGQYRSICEAVGLGDGCIEEYNAAAAAAAAAEQQPALAPTGPESFVDPAADPYAEYVERYVNDAGFRAWFDESYPDRQFCEAVGLEAGCIEVHNERAAAAAQEAERQAREAEAAQEAERQAREAEAAEAAEAEAAEAAAAARQALEESCGEGTVLRDGACVALPPPRDPVGSGRELATGLVAAFVIALVAGAAFWIIHRAGRGRRRQGEDADDGGSSPAGRGAGTGEGAAPSPARAGDAGAHAGDAYAAGGSYGSGGSAGAGYDEPRGRGTIV